MWIQSPITNYQSPITKSPDHQITNGIVRNVIIIGSGPAGLTAALYAARANLQPLLIEGIEAGGQLMLTTMVENCPGYRDGIMGPDLMAEMRAQAERFGAEIIQGNVTSVDLGSQPFVVKTSEHEYHGADAHHRDRRVGAAARAAVRAGADGPRRVDLRDLRRLLLPRPGDRGRRRRRLGDGRSDLPDALRVEGHAWSTAASTLRASKIMQDKARANPKIAWHAGLTRSTRSRTPARAKSPRWSCATNKTGERTEIPVTACSSPSATRRTRRCSSGQLELDRNGYIVTHDGAKTSVPGVFACGDVQDHIYRQAITAAGSGCMAAIDAEHYLDNIPEHLATV